MLVTGNPFYDARCSWIASCRRAAADGSLWMTAAGPAPRSACAWRGWCSERPCSVGRPGTTAGRRPSHPRTERLRCASLTATALAERAVPVSAAGWPTLMGILFCTTAAALTLTAAAVMAIAVGSRARLARVERLGAQLAHMPEGWSAQAALAQLLGDASVVLAFPLDGEERLIDDQGHPGTLGAGVRTPTTRDPPGRIADRLRGCRILDGRGGHAHRSARRRRACRDRQ